MNAMTTFELIVPYHLWKQALMPVMARPEWIATGTVSRDPGRQPTGILVETLTGDARHHTGADFPPLADWIAVAAPGGEPPDDPEPWIRRLKPLYAQMLTLLLVGLGKDRSGWRGWTVERGAVRPLAGFRVIGPGMVRAVVGGDGRVLSEEDDPGRWSRLQGAVGPAAFDKLREAHVAVIGCSRTGTLAAGIIAALGVRGLTLIDGDLIESHNLDGLILAAEANVGANKALCLGQRLVEYRPDLMVKVVSKPYGPTNAESAVAGTDLIVTCVDQDGPRLRAARDARDHLIPHLDIGAGVTQTPTGERQLAADVRLLLPRSGGCVFCVGGLSDPAQAEYELHAPPHALPRRPPEPWNARGRLGSLITLNSQAVAAGIQSWLDLLDGSLTTSIWHRLRWLPGRGLEVNSAAVGAGQGCPSCNNRQLAS